MILVSSQAADRHEAALVEKETRRQVRRAAEKEREDEDRRREEEKLARLVAQERKNEAREAQKSHDSRQMAQQYWSSHQVLPPIGVTTASAAATFQRESEKQLTTAAPRDEEAMIAEAMRLSILETTTTDSRSSFRSATTKSDSLGRINQQQRLYNALNDRPAQSRVKGREVLLTEQHAEFEMALAADRDRDQRLAVDSEERRKAALKAEEDAALRAAEDESRRQMKQSRLPSEPVELKGDGIVDIQVKLPNSTETVRRRFRSQETIQTVYDFLDVELGRDAEGAEGYVLETTFPRAVLCDMSATLAALGFNRGRGMLLLQDTDQGSADSDDA